MIRNPLIDKQQIEGLSEDILSIQQQLTELSNYRDFCYTRAQSAMTGVTGGTKIPLRIMQQKSNNFTISDGSIVVPHNGFVAVSGGIMYSDGCENCYVGVSVKQNESTVTDSYFRYTIGYGAITCRTNIIPVNQGDLFSLFAVGEYESGGAGISEQVRTGITLFYV